MAEHLRLNVGSGQRPFGRPFVNVDVNPRWKPDIVADGASMPMFEDGSAEIIVLHHVLEHAGCGEAAPMIRECHRILKPSGSLLVFVPDMRALATRWLTRQITDQIYFTNVYGAYMNDEADRHKWGYTRESLVHFLRDSINPSRWDSVLPFDWRKIEGADIAGPDFWIAGMEAIK